MCGLAGWIGQPNLTDRQRLARARTLEALLLANASRGTDATGAAAIKHGGGCVLYKRAIDAYEMVEDEQMRRVLRLRDVEVMIGHTRMGTHGANTDRNAHPFRERTLTGAHNGIIWNHENLRMLNAADDWRKPAQVDSQQAFRALAMAPGLVSPDTGLGKVYARALPRIEGQMALVWTDDRDPGHVYLYRDGNPLSVAVVKTAHTAYWSSQSDHLAAAVQTMYGSDWYMAEIKEDIVYRMRWSDEKNDLMIQRFSVDRPALASMGSSGNPYPMRGTVSVGAIPVKGETIWLDECNLCEREITLTDPNKDLDGVWHDEGEGYMLCSSCERWWRAEGLDKYQDLESFMDIADMNGMARSQMRAGESW